MARKKVIYSRYSSDLQSEKSCVDQEREVRGWLTQKGIDHKNAIVIRDEAESGTKSNRSGFEELSEMVKTNEVGILVVDDQSRLTRADNGLSFIKDLVFHGGRFISIGEGIDTAQPGWQMHVKIMDLHNSTSIDELARRVKRGQVGRLVANLSAGDFPFGYESYFLNPESINPSGRGPKPAKKVRIREDHAHYVRLIFSLFVGGRSITSIARELTALGSPVGNRVAGSTWTHQRVRKILGNAKYVGLWVWGRTKTIRNSEGKTKQVPLPEEEWIRSARPELRIVDQDVWDKAQAKLAKIHEVYGFKVGQKKRAPKIHHSNVYPTGMLNGILYCECGRRMVHRQRYEKKYFVCPRARQDLKSCQMTAYVPRDQAIKAVVEAVVTMLQGQSEWRNKVLESMTNYVNSLSKTVPRTLEGLQNREREVTKKIENLIDFLANGARHSESIQMRLAELEAELPGLRWKIAEQQSLVSKPVKLPTIGLLDEQHKNLAAFFVEDSQQAAILLRKLVGKIYATHVLQPGKKRGYTKIRFSLDGWGAMRSAVTDQRLQSIIDALSSSEISEPTHPDEIFVDLGRQTRVDSITPRIVELRRNRTPWKEIAAITGVSFGNAANYYKRYVSALNDRKDTSNLSSLDATFSQVPDSSGMRDDCPDSAE